MSRLLSLLATLPLSLHAAAEETGAAGKPVLRHNPFAVPPEFVGPGVSVGPLTIAPENLALHAIIPGSADTALVSINGVILGVGESFAGNTLISVGAEHARFRRANGAEFEIGLRALEGTSSLPDAPGEAEETPAADAPEETAEEIATNNNETTEDEQAP